MTDEVERCTRRDLLAALLLAGVALALGAGRMYVGVCGGCHDDAIYVINARALAEGEGYRLVNLPGAPPQTKYPILYPAVLALIWAAWPTFPDNLLAMQGFSLLCAAGLVAGAYLYLVRFRYVSRRVAFASSLLCATSPAFLFFGTVTMSEMLFGVLLAAALWGLDRARRAHHSWLVGLTLGLLLALPFLCRSVGIVLLPAGLLVLWRAGRPVRWAALGAALAVAPWWLWTASMAVSWQKDPVQGYYTDYFGWYSALGVPALAKVVGINALCLVTGASSLPLDGLGTPLQQANLHVFLLLSGLLGLAALAGLLGRLRQGTALPAFLALYLLLVWVWPWVPYRFLIPVLPFVFAFLLDALGRLPWPGQLQARGPVLAGALGLCAVVANVGLWAHYCQMRRDLDTPSPELPRPACWSGYRELFAWLDAHSDPQDIIAAGADPMVSLYTRRRAFYPIVCPPLYLFYQPQEGDDLEREESLAGLRAYRPRFLATLPNHHGEERFRAWVGRLQKSFPDHVVPVYTGADPRFAIYEIHYPLEAPSPPAATAHVAGRAAP